MTFGQIHYVIKPFTCSEEEWKKEFEELKKKLKDVYHLGDTPHPGTIPEVSQKMHAANIQTSLSAFVSIGV